MRDITEPMFRFLFHFINFQLAHIVHTFSMASMGFANALAGFIDHSCNRLVFFVKLLAAVILPVTT